MKKFSFILLTVLLTAGIVYLNSCRKDGTIQQIQNTTTLDDETNQAMLQHILDFKKRMEYYRNNPGLRSTDSLYTADSAVLEMESLLNFNFCYTDIVCNKKKFVKTEVTMPLDEMGKIGESKLAQLYYDEIIDSIQARMLDVNYPDIKLLLVDLEQTGTDENGDAIVSIGALVGNEGTISNTNEQGWWFGKEAGDCQGGYAGWDATMQITRIINFIHFPAPLPGWIRRKTDIITLPEYLPGNYPLVSDNERDNYEDFKLYYAEEDANHNPPLHITDDTRCVSSDEEEIFYTDWYNQFILDAEEDNNLEFTDCVIDWHERLNNSGVQDKIWHTLTITLGHVWLVKECSLTIDNILAY